MLKKKYLITVSLLLYILLFACLFNYSGLYESLIQTQCTILYISTIFITLFEVSAIILYVKLNKQTLLHISTILTFIVILYSNFAIAFVGEEYSSIVTPYIISFLPKIFSNIFLLCIYLVGIVKLNDTENIALNNKILIVFAILSFLLFLLGCISVSSYGFSASSNTNYAIVRNFLTIGYNFFIALILLSIGFWLEVKGKLTKTKIILIYLLYLAFTILIIFMPYIVAQFATEEVFENVALSAFLYSLNSSFYNLASSAIWYSLDSSSKNTAILSYHTQELNGLSLVFVITELICYLIIYCATIIFVLIKDKTENRIDEPQEETSALEKSLSKIEKLLVYKEAEIISDEEFNDLKSKALYDENFSFDLDNRDFENLKRLKDLYDKKVLTAEEYQAEKSKIIIIENN